jgi:perosamine synthetase
MIPVNEPLLSGNEAKYLHDCIHTGWISSEGPFIKKMEDGFATATSRKYGVAVSNGTAALVTAFQALNLPRGSEVIMPTFCIISCAIAVLQAGLIPVLVDSEPHNWNMNTGELKTKLTKKTRAILVVHTYGHPVDMDPVVDFASRHNLLIVEDAAEMLGQDYKGQPCGKFGEISCFSMYANKIVTSGEGGMIVTDNEQLAQKCFELRNLCFQPKRRFLHEELGFNFRITNLQAAVGLAQLERLQEFKRIKRRMGDIYNQAFAGMKEIEILPKQTSFSENIYWVYGFLLSECVPFGPEEMAMKLQALGVGTRPFFVGMHQQPVFLKRGLFSADSYPVADRLTARGLYLPSGLALTEGQQHEVIAKVRQTLRSYAKN